MKYLVVQTKQIGDVLISTALCNNLKQHDPAGEVHYLVMDYCAGMAQGNPNIDRLIVIDHEGLVEAADRLGLFVWGVER